MLCAGLTHVLWNMTHDIIHKDNELTTRDKPSKDSDNQTAANMLYASAKKVSHCCQEGSPFEKGSVTNAIHGARKAWCECFNYNDTKLKKEKRS
jgi:hypothetical protein